LEKQNEIHYWFLKFIRYESIGAGGAAKIGEGVSKLLNLTSLNLNFR
jgi:hypothetical protein